MNYIPTLQECADKHRNEGIGAVINDGKAVRFERDGGMTRAEIVEKLLSEASLVMGEGCEVKHFMANKDNSVKYPAFSIRELGSEVSINIDISDWMKGVAAGKQTAKAAAKGISGIYDAHKKKAVVFSNVIKGLSKEKILENVVCQLLNAEWNKEMLECVPHERLMDLAVVYRAVVNIDRRYVTFIVNHSMRQMFGIQEQELKRYARWNTELKGFNSFSVSSLYSETERPSMWAFTNSNGRYGAAAMLFPILFERLSRNLASSLYIFPYSVHELIAVSTKGLKPKDLRKMARLINKKIVNEEEALSDNVYMYDITKKQIKIVQ